jgi:hypothetical protein
MCDGWSIRPSISPEQLLLALLLLNTKLFFRWIVGLNPDYPVWPPTMFMKIGTACLTRSSWPKVLELLLAAGEVKSPLSSEHFSVDGTLLWLLAIWWTGL